jgi:hypothetical protein
MEHWRGAVIVTNNGAGFQSIVKSGESGRVVSSSACAARSPSTARPIAAHFFVQYNPRRDAAWGFKVVWLLRLSFVAGFQIADVAAHVSLPVAQVGKAALNLF